VSREEILGSIFRVIDLFNRQAPESERLAKSEDTVLYGPDAKLDSLGLVTLIVNTEQQIADDFGKSVSLANEKALSERNSPFRTVGSLVSYVSALITGQQDA